MCCDWEISVARLVAWLDFHIINIEREEFLRNQFQISFCHVLLRLKSLNGYLAILQSWFTMTFQIYRHLLIKSKSKLQFCFHLQIFTSTYGGRTHKTADEITYHAKSL